MDDAEQPAVRASDADREQVAERLRTAFDEGRLGLAEYDERVRDAYAAVTRADLVPLTADLPAAAEAAAPPAKRSRAPRLRKEWRDWAQTGFLLVGIWAVISLAGGGPIFFFPIFPLGIWAVVLVSQALFGHGDSDGSGCDEDGDDENGDDEPDARRLER
ncbi:MULTISPECIES: DUF1707 domain-containing protein [unclassified Saccharopolyspora]|uniref:DUF1707 SHOCT-like domain-containing protein n=1 Tax=unclassified Saccharopolyspora TaxID=2646250 RepID=UPI001CD66441|nr:MULTISPECIES: DUF1707 domain-containing protein [unclassified Saccharopolyspora]MCA1188383.1 DUF1707 domain-containing protein [Saccharopolyspora sp. 6T]MCA1194793.1 DUF1707 domain-containing protein [Saccharopolyspora sp. 6V]MCA1228245.1 DUF1707 domain-containing protein [Saccharopolyspora sp. 6M]MCA1281305.1 DUF1707 domain-containing protein [Saccharopolyspora sp. 7B]